MGTVTQNDVAREAGVTRSMVSYVISGNSGRSVAPETRKRILDAIKKLGYRPNKAAQALQLGDVAFASKKIGVVLCSEDFFLRPYYAEIISGIYSRAHELNYSISFMRFFGELKNPVLFNELIHEEEIGGIILVALDQVISSPEDEKIIEDIKKRLSRVICVEWKFVGLSSVMFDRMEAAKKAAEYLYDAGHRKIVYMGENDERVEGVSCILSLHDLPSGRNDFFFAEGFDAKFGFGAIDSCMTENLPEAIVCGSDEVAIGVLSALSKKNVDVPSRVAVISIDNIENSEFTNPPLTTMNVPKKQMGIKAVEMVALGKSLTGDDAVCVMLPTDIVIRSSC